MKLISYALCPYAQRVSIVLDEKARRFERINIDLANKPDWFLALSPHGKVPLLKDGDAVLFESVAILEYLEDTIEPVLYPTDPAARAHMRAWVAFAGSLLNAIGRLYSARDAVAYEGARVDLRREFEKLEQAAAEAGWPTAAAFSLLDAVYAPVFRYFDLFDQLLDHGLLAGLEALAAWRQRLAARPSVQRAVAATYTGDLRAFLGRRNSFLLKAAA
ncbi:MULTISPECIES: glutathione S-transferase family protein [Kordiimonas]|jgi:glutathione S-transferase|uniref:glutathione S-transferase family protein n=1 Tax=Kordiimonas TaxID=288021 RepID=UPI002579DC7C|nr:glutathione S-transferase family protein [Kordiimonas sp. UBA4487]